MSNSNPTKFEFKLLSKISVLIGIQPIKIRHLIKKLIGWKDEKIS